MGKNMRLALACCFLLVALSRAQYQECSNKLSVLENALFNTGDNQKRLNSDFFPSHQRTSRYLKVTYKFLQGNDSDDECTVTYFWSVGTFLFIQPPTVLQFTSLYFSFPANDIRNTTVTLPSECRSIVFNNETQKCSCKAPGDTFLDILTRHLLEYAKYTEGQVVRNEFSTARAVCDEELTELYYNTTPVILFFVFVILLAPITSALILLLFVAGNSKNIKQIVGKTEKYASLSGIFLTSIYVALYAVIMKITGIIYAASSNHEYKDYNISYSFNILIVYITFGVDFFAIAGWIVIFIMILLNKCSILNDLHEVKHVLWIGFPVILTSSHSGYIIIAWLTEPQKTSSICFIMLCALFFLFATFRSLYTISNYKPNASALCKFVKWFENCGNRLKKNHEIVVRLVFSGLAGIFGVGLTCAYLAIFIILPVPAYELANYFENIIRIILVLAAGLITYRVLSFELSDAGKFWKTFKENIQHTPVTDTYENEFEYSGAMAGLIFNYLLSKYVEKNSVVKITDMEQLIYLFNQFEKSHDPGIKKLKSEVMKVVELCKQDSAKDDDLVELVSRISSRYKALSRNGSSLEFSKCISELQKRHLPDDSVETETNM